MSKIMDWLMLLFTGFITVDNLIWGGVIFPPDPGNEQIFRFLAGGTFLLIATSMAWSMGASRSKGQIISTDAQSRKFLLNREWSVTIGAEILTGLRLALIRDLGYIRVIYLTPGDPERSGRWTFEKIGGKIYGRLLG